MRPGGAFGAGPDTEVGAVSAGVGGIAFLTHFGDVLWALVWFGFSFGFSVGLGFDFGSWCRLGLLWL